MSHFVAQPTVITNRDMLLTSIQKCGCSYKTNVPVFNCSQQRTTETVDIGVILPSHYLPELDFDHHPCYAGFKLVNDTYHAVFYAGGVQSVADKILQIVGQYKLEECKPQPALAKANLNVRVLAGS